jgi:ribosomal protein S27AE
MKREEFSERLLKSQKQLRRDAAWYLGKVFITLILLAIVATVLFEGKQEVEFTDKIIAIGLLVTLFVSMLFFAHQSDRIMAKSRIKCEKCGKEWFPFDVKIVIASKHCPYCGEGVIQNAQQSPAPYLEKLDTTSPSR